MEAISLWHCSGVMEAQVSLTVAFRSSALLGLVSLIFLLTIPHRFSMGFRSGEFAGQSSTVTPWSLTSFGTFGSVGRCQGPAGKWNQHLHKLVSRRAHEVLWNFLVDGCVDCGLQKHSGPTPADDMAPQIITDCGNFTLDFKQHGFCASPHLFFQTLGPWFPMKCKISFIWKEDFGPLSNSTVIFLLSPGKMLLTLSLVQKWLGSPFPEDVWAWWLLMHWLQLQSTPCEALPSVWISFAWQYSQACGHPCCLCTFSYPNSSFQSTLHVICFDTALCKQPHLSVMTLCDIPSLWRASMFIFWIIAKSAVFSIIVVSKNKRYPEFIL